RKPPPHPSGRSLACGTSDVEVSHVTANTAHPMYREGLSVAAPATTTPCPSGTPAATTTSVLCYVAASALVVVVGTRDSGTLPGATVLLRSTSLPGHLPRGQEVALRNL
ncbi:unnamed protein product, partial [Ectocarpus sp. 4 AP-2014]